MELLKLILALLGGLSLFVVGSYSLYYFMNQLKQKWTRNYFTILKYTWGSFLAGVLMTLLFQSSMISLLVTSILLITLSITLAQSFTMIWGIHIGVFLSHYRGNFALEHYFYLFIFIGVIFYFILDKRYRAVGGLLFSLGLLYLGIEIVKNALIYAQTYYFKGFEIPFLLVYNVSIILIGLLSVSLKNIKYSRRLLPLMIFYVLCFLFFDFIQYRPLNLQVMILLMVTLLGIIVMRKISNSFEKYLPYEVDSSTVAFKKIKEEIKQYAQLIGTFIDYKKMMEIKWDEVQKEGLPILATMTRFYTLETLTAKEKKELFYLNQMMQELGQIRHYMATLSKMNQSTYVKDNYELEQSIKMMSEMYEYTVDCLYCRKAHQKRIGLIKERLIQSQRIVKEKYLVLRYQESVKVWEYTEDDFINCMDVIMTHIVNLSKITHKVIN